LISPLTPPVAPESLKDLPSLGSLGHFAGLCSRCCFHSKGRCQNGYDCRFCHFDHEKRQRKKKVAFNSRGLATTLVHRPLDNRGYHNEAWAMSAPPTPQYVSAPPTPHYVSGSPTCQYVSGPPGLDVPCPPPPPGSPPFNNQLLNLPSPLTHCESPAAALPPTAPPASPAPALLGPIAGAPAGAPQSEVFPCAPTANSMQTGGSSVEKWPVEKVAEWLTSVGLSHISKSFEEHRITGDVLLELDSSDLDEIGVRALGDKKRLLRAVVQLKAPEVQTSCPPPPLTPAPCWQAPSWETNPWGSSPMSSMTPPPSFNAPLM